MAEITIDELEERLSLLASGRLRQLLIDTLGPAGVEIEATVRQNVQSRLTMRSRSLLNTIRHELADRGEDVVLAVSVGGTFGGLDVAYAHLQEEGGQVTPKSSKHLAIPIENGLTGPGIARYSSVRQMPFAAFRPVKGRKARWIVYDKRNDQVFFLLVTSVDVPGKHYLRDAVAAHYPGLPGRLIENARRGLQGEL